MKIHNSDILFGTVCTFVCIIVSFCASFAFNNFIYLPHGLQGIFLVFVFIIFFNISTILLMYVLRLRRPFTDGELYLDNPARSVTWKLFGYLYVTHLWPLINANLVPVNLRSFAFSMLGAKIGRSVMIGGKILDPSLVEIGDYTMLGEDCLLTAHAVEGDIVDLGRITIGRSVTVGVKAVILPDVIIGDGAIVAAGAVVTKGTRISPGEIWGGVPAKKIGVVTSRNTV